MVQARGREDTVIRERFDMSPTRYYQALNALIDSDARTRPSPCWSRAFDAYEMNAARNAPPPGPRDHT